MGRRTVQLDLFGNPVCTKYKFMVNADAWILASYLQKQGFRCLIDTELYLSSEEFTDSSDVDEWMESEASRKGALIICVRENRLPHFMLVYGDRSRIHTSLITYGLEGDEDE
jgi:hypothetical protein